MGLGGRFGAGAVALALAAGGCAFARNTAVGQAIHDGPKVLARQRALGMSLTVTARLVSQGTLPERPAPPPPAEFTGTVDLTAGQAAYYELSSKQPAVVFDGDTVYGLTPGAAPDDARPWAAVVVDKHLSDTRLDPSGAPVTTAAAETLRPSLLIDFLDGALTGSIHRAGTATVDGVATTAYMVRYDYSQALGDATRTTYSQRAQDDVTKLLKVLSVDTNDLGSGEVWIDASGMPRKVVETLVEAPAPQSRIEVTFTMTFSPSDQATITVPRPDSVVTMPSLFEFLTSTGTPQ